MLLIFLYVFFKKVNKYFLKKKKRKKRKLHLTLRDVKGILCKGFLNIKVS